MTSTASTATTASATGSDRRSLLTFGWITTILAALHLTDHALRGERIHDRQLNPAWDHSGWPFQPDVTPYTFSLVAVAVILGVGLWGTHRHKLWAGYWLGAALVLGAIVTVVHFLPTAQQESPSVIYNSWQGLDVLGVVAVANTFAIVLSLLLMAGNAIRVNRHSGRWR